MIGSDRMRVREDVALQPVSADAQGRRCSEVLANGRNTGLRVVGEELGACVEASEKLILFVQYGDPYEESLGIYLVDSAWHVLDKAVLGAMGASGNLHELTLVSPTTLTFRFFADRLWRLRLHDSPRVRAPISSLGLGVRRPLKWRRWFDLGPA